MGRVCARKFVHHFGESEGKRLLGRPRSTWKNGIKMGLTVMEWCGLESLRSETSGRLLWTR